MVDPSLRVRGVERLRARLRVAAQLEVQQQRGRSVQGREHGEHRLPAVALAEEPRGRGGEGDAEHVADQKARQHQLALVVRDGVADPGHGEPAVLHGDAADGPEKAVAVLQADDCLVGLAERRVQLVQAPDALLGGPALADVADHALAEALPVDLEEAAADLHREGRAVAAPVHRFVTVAAALRDSLDVALVGCRLLGRAQVLGAHAEQLVARVAVALERPVVGVDDARALVHQDDDVVGVLRQDVEALREAAVLELQPEAAGLEGRALSPPPQPDRDPGPGDEKRRHRGEQHGQPPGGRIDLVAVDLGHEQPVGSVDGLTHSEHRRIAVVEPLLEPPGLPRQHRHHGARRVRRDAQPERGVLAVAQLVDVDELVAVHAHQHRLGRAARGGPGLDQREQVARRIDLEEDGADHPPSCARRNRNGRDQVDDEPGLLRLAHPPELSLEEAALLHRLEHELALAAPGVPGRLRRQDGLRVLVVERHLAVTVEPVVLAQPAEEHLADLVLGAPGGEPAGDDGGEDRIGHQQLAVAAALFAPRGDLRRLERGDRGEVALPVGPDLFGQGGVDRPAEHADGERQDAEDPRRNPARRRGFAR